MKKRIQASAIFGLGFLIFLGLFISQSYAEPGDPFTGASSLTGPAGRGAASASSGTAAASPDFAAERTKDGRYYLDFKETALINVLNVLSNLSGINFVAGPEVADRKVNMTLDNVSLEDVLDSIARGSNVAYDILPGRNIYLFRASSYAFEQPALMTRVFRLYYVRVSTMKEIEVEASDSGDSSSGGGLSTLSSDDEEEGGEAEESAIYLAIEKILSERGRVSIDDRSNSLIVTDTEDRLRMIEAALMELDRPLDQVLINVLLVETFEDLSRDLGVEWGDANGYFGTVTGGIQETQWPFRFGGQNNNGVNFKNFFEGFGDAVSDTARQFNPTNDSAAGALTTSGTRDFTAFTIAVRALESASKLKVLAKPKVLVLDNHAAVVKIATNAAIGVVSVTAGAGGATGTTTDSTERAEVGTILRVTPLINTGDRITMTVEPTFATVSTSTITVSAAETGDPTVRQARTTLMVNDGQTIALGGLLLSSQTNANRKVPFFGNLPVVGKALFTSNAKDMEDRELILFVTPYIIRDPSMLETPSVPDERLRFDDETAPFWKVKQKDWYKELKDGPKPATDYESYFNVRKRLMDTTLANLDQSAQAASQRKP